MFYNKQTIKVILFIMIIQFEQSLMIINLIIFR